MFDAVIIKRKYDFFSTYNGIFYFLQRIPLIGKIFNKSNKWLHKLEFLTLPLSFIFSILSAILRKAIFYLFVFSVVYGIQDIINDTETIGHFSVFNDFNNVVFYLTAITLIGSIRDHAIFYENDRPKYILVKQMKLGPRNYNLGNYFYSTLENIFTHSLVFWFIFNGFAAANNLSNPFSLLNIFSFITFAYSIRFLIAYFGLIADYIKNGIVDNAIFIVMTLLWIVSIVLIFTGKAFDLSFFYNPLLLIVGIGIFAVTSYLFINNQKIENVVYRSLIAKDLEIDGDVMAKVSGLKVKEGSIVKDERDFSQYKGIEYINRIFFHRHRKPLFKKSLLANGIKILIFLGLSVTALYLGPEIDLNNPEDFKNVEELKQVMPYSIFMFAYLLFSGDFFIKYCFYNMDKDIMKHAYYRTPENLLSSVKIRAKKLIEFHLPAFIAQTAMIIIVTFALKFSLGFTLWTLFVSLVAMLFFNLHYLYIYYILQPFTVGAEVKNPLYSGISYLIYMLMFFGTTSGQTELILNGVLIFAFVYIVLGAFLVYKLGPKRFKLK